MNKKQKAIIFSSAGFLIWSIACATTPQPTQQANVNVAVQKSNDSAVVSSHSKEQLGAANNSSQTVAPAQKSEGKTKWTQSGDPIDTSAFDVEIEKAEKQLKAKPADETAKKALAESYLKRAVALTGARQYASALGDYRRVLKYDAGNQEAKGWVEQITGIYESINREAPKEGEEPPPLPFNKKG
jgi:hypothetical protein